MLSPMHLNLLLIIQDTWEEVDPDELSYEELLALGEVVGTESRGLSAATIASLPSINYKTGSSQNGSNDSCVICRLDYEDGETLTLLSCKHSYHSECINNWLKINKACPVCNTETRRGWRNQDVLRVNLSRAEIGFFWIDPDGRYIGGRYIGVSNVYATGRLCDANRTRESMELVIDSLLPSKGKDIFRDDKFLYNNVPSFQDVKDVRALKAGLQAGDGPADAPPALLLSPPADIPARHDAPESEISSTHQRKRLYDQK
ncbi:hypothetical protein DKX38_007533 [Salix brachista]|uniref:RING-type domain-containing protein n=1 Tax=Salix brachista TaxID=2182728 RepID=A0A5N5MNG1_9ROSI|nr:hypothetical protein DKX38_007533 [Salix brachista]